MNPNLMHLAHALWITLCATLALAGALSVLRGLGATGEQISAQICRAPLLDVIVACFTWLPWVLAAFAGWAALLGAFVGQIVALGIWCIAHEWAHRDAARGPRIVKFLNKTVGRWRNHLALWVTLIALPGFWLIRIMQIISYWPLVVLLGFPKYKHADWINVSRHKFDGLVGHDLIWCLYCDWMTGVYSLGAEMLRNVESFWCPIRFYEGKKCENCRIDFPDLEHGWVSAAGNMGDVDALMQEKYGDGQRTWYAHPARLTIKGR